MRKLVLALSLVILASEAKAATIATLYNTCLDASGSPIADGSVDPHYTLTQVPANSIYGPATYVTDSDRYPIQGAWMQDSSTSKWISPTADQSTFPDYPGSGVYDYRTTFDLTGFDPATAIITGQWETDNSGLDILINGLSTGNTHVTPPTYNIFSSFTISSGFQSGINTLDFIVDNAAVGNPADPGLINPTGLRVELSGTVNAVPEPSTLLLSLVGGTLVLGGRARKKRQTK